MLPYKLSASSLDALSLGDEPIPSSRKDCGRPSL